MSRTWKDRPYRLSEREAINAGYWYIWPNIHGGWDVHGDVASYRAATGKPVCSHSRWNDYRDYEREWRPSYGNPTRIRSILRHAADEHNCGLMDADWDDPIVYQRRRIWTD